MRTGRGEIFRRDVLTADHVMASACLPQLFQAVQIGGEAYWDGGYAGNPPLWPLFYETACRDVIIVQINPIERAEIPRTPEEIMNRLNEITFNASLLGELRAADFVARLIRSGVLKSDELPARAAASHRRRGPARGLPRLDQVRRVLAVSSSGCATSAAPTPRPGSSDTYDSIGVESTLDIDQTLKREPAKDADRGRGRGEVVGALRRAAVLVAPSSVSTPSDRAVSGRARPALQRYEPKWSRRRSSAISSTIATGSQAGAESTISRAAPRATMQARQSIPVTTRNGI